MQTENGKGEGSIPGVRTVLVVKSVFFYDLVLIKRIYIHKIFKFKYVAQFSIHPSNCTATPNQ